MTSVSGNAPEPRLALMRGLPRSGKTTFAKTHLCAPIRSRAPYVRVSPDDIRLALHGQAFYGPAEPFVWATALVMARSLLIGGSRVVIDATNLTVESRRQWFTLAKDTGARIAVYDVDTPLETCVIRNTNAGEVPLDVIRRMATTAQPLSESEGNFFYSRIHGATS